VLHPSHFFSAKITFTGKRPGRIDSFTQEIYCESVIAEKFSDFIGSDREVLFFSEVLFSPEHLASVFTNNLC